MIPKRNLDEKKTIELLKEGSYGILSTISPTGMPYGVAVNYFYVADENAIYFHTKPGGTKMINIRSNPNVSLFIVRNEQIIPKKFTTHYQSVLVAGTASVVEEKEQIIEKLYALCEKFAPNVTERREEVIQKYLKAVAICKISITAITGKQNMDT